MTDKEKLEIQKEKEKALKKQEELKIKKELSEKRKQEARESEEFQKEVMGESSDSTITIGKRKIAKHPVWNGFKFLGKSFASQWKVLLSITFIFFSIVVILAALTFGFDRLTPGGNFNIHDGIIPGLNDDKYITFFESLWWVFITISTIGYGDIYPTTEVMKFWAMLIGIVGIIFVSLYTAVVVNGFAIEMQKNLEKRRARMESQTKKIDPETRIKNLRQEIKLKDDEIKGLMIAIASLSGKSSAEIRKAINESIESFKETEEIVKKNQIKNK